jgi:hypothetical protein
MSDVSPLSGVSRTSLGWLNSVKNDPSATFGSLFSNPVLAQLGPAPEEASAGRHYSSLASCDLIFPASISTKRLALSPSSFLCQRPTSFPLAFIEKL